VYNANALLVSLLPETSRCWLYAAWHLSTCSSVLKMTACTAHALWVVFSESYASADSADFAREKFQACRPLPCWRRFWCFEASCPLRQGVVRTKASTPPSRRTSLCQKKQLKEDTTLEESIMSGTVRPTSKPEMRGSITLLVLGDGEEYFVVVLFDLLRRALHVGGSTKATCFSPMDTAISLLLIMLFFVVFRG